MAKKTVTSKVKEGLKSNKSNIAKDIIAGTTFGEAVVGEGDLGRIANDADVQKSLSVLRQGADGFSSKEAMIRREKALEGIGSQTQAAQRGFLSAAGRAGVRGGAAGKQLRDIQAAGVTARANAERDLFLAGEQARQSGARTLLDAAQGVKRFDLGQAAKEKNIALQAGMGFASLGSAERAAFLSSQAAGAGGGGASGGGGGGGIFGAITGNAINPIGGAVNKVLGGGTLGKVGGFLASPATSVAKKVFKPIGKIFCHTGDTEVQMDDGSLKRLDEIKLGDEVLGGGRVVCIGQAEANDDIYLYKGETCTGSHMVELGGSWAEVKTIDSEKTDLPQNTVVYPIATENGFYITKAGYLSADVVVEDLEATNVGFTSSKTASLG